MSSSSVYEETQPRRSVVLLLLSSSPSTSSCLDRIYRGAVVTCRLRSLHVQIASLLPLQKGITEAEEEVEPVYVSLSLPLCPEV